MSETSVFIEALDRLRSEVIAQHQRQGERVEGLRLNTDQGFRELKTLLQMQNGRVAKNEQDIVELRTASAPVTRLVYGLVALMLSSVVLGIVSLVLRIEAMGVR